MKIKPEVLLLSYDAFYRHSTGKTYHSDYRQADRKLVAHHPGARTERADEGKLIVRRPTGQQNTEHTYRRNGDKEENADIEVDNLQTVAPRKHRESKHRSDDYQVRREGEKEAVDMVEMNNLFNEHLEHIGEAPHKPIGPTRFGPRRH